MNLKTFDYRIYVVLLISIVILLGLSLFGARNYPLGGNGPDKVFFDEKNAEYIIENQTVRLINGVSEVAVPGTESKTTTRFFGNEAKKDLNGDGREDIVFLLTQDGGGSGTFFYVVAALNTLQGYVGSQGFFLGDRIAPQTTESGPGNSVIVNYAERRPEDSFGTQPSVGVSLRLILDPKTMQFSEL